MLADVAPPSMLICVDEFAAGAQPVPERRNDIRVLPSAVRQEVEQQDGEHRDRVVHTVAARDAGIRQPGKRLETAIDRCEPIVEARLLGAQGRRLFRHVIQSATRCERCAGDSEIDGDLRATAALCWPHVLLEDRQQDDGESNQVRVHQEFRYLERLLSGIRGSLGLTFVFSSLYSSAFR